MATRNFVIVHTGGGIEYANRIARSVEWINDNKPIGNGHIFNTITVPFSEVNLPRQFVPENTIIHSRAAHPNRGGWMGQLFRLKELGYLVINDPEVLYLTSNKVECSLELQEHFPHPRTWVWNRGKSFHEFSALFGDVELTIDEDSDCVVAKPETSMEQGANVRKIAYQNMTTAEILTEVEQIPGRRILIQEYVPYSAIYRVVVIGGRALPYSFVDRPTPDRWKVSVCLNRTSMEFVPNPPPRLLELGEEVQKFIGGEINFIDFFEVPFLDADRKFHDGYGKFVISEINTACNLRIHEILAKEAGHSRWNIHFNIARYLVERSLT